MTGKAPAAVEVVDLVKRYPKSDTNAVDGISFSVAAGEVFGLLGPNGAGKSTMVGILTTRVRATSGRVSVGGVDVLAEPVAARAQLAVLPQHNNLDRALTPRQNLTYHAAYHGIGKAARDSRAGALLRQFGLEAQADTRIDWYSGGMAQRLMLARSLIHEPAVLFLDEPTNALDPQSRLLIRSQIREVRDRGVTVVLTTHQMNEAAELVDRVAIVDHGRLIAIDTPSSLISGLGSRSMLDLTVETGHGDDADALLEALCGVDGVHRGERLRSPAPGGEGLAGGPGALRAAVMAAGPAARAALRAAMSAAGPAGRAALRDRAVATLANSGALGPVRLRLHLSADPASTLGPVLALLSLRCATLRNVQIAEPSLEDVFIELTGRESR